MNLTRSTSLVSIEDLQRYLILTSPTDDVALASWAQTSGSQFGENPNLVEGGLDFGDFGL